MLCKSYVIITVGRMVFMMMKVSLMIVVKTLASLFQYVTSIRHRVLL